MTTPFPGVVKRYHEYYYADGLNELVRGVNGTLSGGLILALAARDPSWSRLMAGTALLVVMVTIDVFEKRILGAIRERISYSRIGLVEPITLVERGMHRRNTVIWALFILFIVLGTGGSLLIVFGVIRVQNPMTMPNYWIPAVCALALGGVSIHEGLRLTGRRHAIAMGVIIIAFGIVLSMTDARLLSALAFLGIGWGLIVAVSGAFTLRRFLRTPVPAEPAGV